MVSLIFTVVNVLQFLASLTYAQIVRGLLSESVIK